MRKKAKERRERTGYSHSAYMKEYYVKNKEVLKQKEGKRNEENPEIRRGRDRDYYKRNKKARLSYLKEWRDRNRGYIREKGKDYYRDHKERYIAASAKRHSVKLQATPLWFEKEAVDTLYEKRAQLSVDWGIMLHVDHVVPLQGKNVCGLHCHANLQLLEARMNIVKGNSHV